MGLENVDISCCCGTIACEQQSYEISDNFKNDDEPGVRDFDFDQLILERVDRDRYHYGWIHVSYDINRLRRDLLVCYKGEYTSLYPKYMKTVEDMEEIMKYEL